MTSPYWRVEPEVAGELGKQTVLHRSIHAPSVTTLHYVLHGWLGDDIIEAFPCFVISTRMADEIARLGLTGFVLRDVKVTTARQFEELHPGLQLPRFTWLDVTASHPELTDFRLDPGARLEVTDRALGALRRFRLANAEISQAW